MKKIGILTFHFSENYGAVLQCYALRKLINTIPGYTAEIINLISKDRRRWYDNPVLQEKYEEKLQKYKIFNQVENGIANEPIYNINELNQEEYFGFVVGSDQVWNISLKSFKTAYLLDFANERPKKIAYAASVGMNIDNPLLKTELFQKYIKRFDSISVRENTHQSFIQQFTDKKVYAVLDPTLLIEKEMYDKLIENMNNLEDLKEEYIFFYYLKNDNTIPLACSFVNMLARKYNLKILHYCVEMPEQVFKNQNKSFYYDGPKEFLWHIKHAKIVVTNSFHGTIFSILYNKPFYTYLVENMKSRVIDLLSNLGLENRIISGYKPLDDIELEIDYKSVNEKINQERKRSKDFLINSLDK